MLIRGGVLGRGRRPPTSIDGAGMGWTIAAGGSTLQVAKSVEIVPAQQGGGGRSLVLLSYIFTMMTIMMMLVKVRSDRSRYSIPSPRVSLRETRAHGACPPGRTIGVASASGSHGRRLRGSIEGTAAAGTLDSSRSHAPVRIMERMAWCTMENDCM